jgi:large subunit ribosomal protein L4
MNLPVVDKNAKKVSEVEVNESVFNAKVNDKVLAQYVYVYLSNQRESNAQTKDKSEVRGGGKKPWAQKGTGRARAGSSRSPLWKGGGNTFGPTNKTNWKRKLTKSFKASAFRNAFSKLNQAGLLTVVESIELKEPSTKEAVSIKANFENPKKMMIITAKKNENLIKSFSNVEKAKVALISEVNVYDLLNAGKVLIEKETLDYINNTWA